MKHLKLFESSNSDYYQSISQIEYVNLINTKREKNREPKIKKGLSIKDIMRSMSPWDKKELNALSEFSKQTKLDFDPDIADSDDLLIFSRHGKVEIVIYKLEDEYYLVSLQSRDPRVHKLWKCDQLDGLIMFLNDKFISKII